MSNKLKLNSENNWHCSRNYIVFHVFNFVMSLEIYVRKITKNPSMSFVCGYKLVKLHWKVLHASVVIQYEYNKESEQEFRTCT